MSCYNASGVRSITLYENIGLSYVYTNNTTLQAVVTSGQTINITQDLRPDYSDSESMGANFKLLHNHSVKFYNFDMIEGITQQNVLNNVYGWIAAITFNDGESYVIQSPLFFTEGTELNSANTHTWEFTLKSEVDTEAGLIDYIFIAQEGIGYMTLQIDFIVT